MAYETKKYICYVCQTKATGPREADKKGFVGCYFCHRQVCGEHAASPIANTYNCCKACEHTPQAEKARIELLPS